MTRKEYNGWTNYETWVVKLWMDNDEGSQSYYQEIAEDVARSNRGQANPEYDLADRLKAAHEEQLPEVKGFAADLLNAAMSEINWLEIAESMLSELTEA